MLAPLLAETRAAVLRDEPLVVVPELSFPLSAVLRIAEVRRGAERTGQLTYLVGPRHSGKSHLARHGVREALRRQPRLKLGWLPAADWVAVLQEAAAYQSLAELLTECGRLHVVVCEDLDEALGDVDALDILVGWLDALRIRDVRVLVTSSQPAGQLDRLPPRLLSRLHGGLTARLTPLGADSRLEFLRQRALLHGISLSDEIHRWLRDNVGGSIGQMCDALQRLNTAFRREEITPTLPHVQRWLQSAVETPPVSLAMIATEVAGEFHVTLTDLRSGSRQQALRLPRQCAMYLAREVGRWPLETIGQYFGHRTHTSVSHSCRRLRELIANSPTLRQQVLRLTEGLRERCASAS